MKKINSLLVIFGIGLMLMSILAWAEEDHKQEIEEGKKLVESKVSCNQLTNEQLEVIGEYYMEQMHPGESHELMDKMMGGEGSESLEQMHINMAKRLYCNENVSMGCGMMGSGMGNMMSSGTMGMMSGDGMMTTNKAYKYGGMMGMMGSNMMGNNTWPFSFWSIANLIFMILFWGLIIWLVVWLITKYTKQQAEKTESAIEILKKRFAKGEITKKQYEEMKKELRER